MAEEKKKFVGKNGKIYDPDEMYSIVRKFLQNEELPENELRIFMKSEMFLDMCPDFFEALNSNETAFTSVNVVRKSIEEETKDKEKHSKKKEEKSLKPKVEHVQEKHHVKKESKESHTPKKPNKSKVCLISSDSEDINDTKSKRDTKNKERTRKRRSSSGSSSSESLFSPIQIHHNTLKDKKRIKTDADAKDSKNLDDLKHMKKVKEAQSLSKMQLEKEKKKKLERRERRLQEKQANRKKHLLALEPKPYSYYSKSASKIDFNKHWKPQEEPEFQKMKKEHNLKALSVVCVDLLRIDAIFHHPSKTPISNFDSVPLKSRMNIPHEEEKRILKLEKVKRISFKLLLNRLYAKSLRKKLKKRVPSDDSSSDPAVPKNNRPHQRPKIKNKEKINPRRENTEWKKEQTPKERVQIKDKNKQKTSDDKLPRKNKLIEWKKDSFDNQWNDNKNQILRKFKISKKNPPPTKTISYLEPILQQIATANQEEAKKPLVKLVIPKKSDKDNWNKRPPENNIQIGPVAIEVSKVLQSQTKVHVPMLGNNLANYTIQKIAWWFLKSDKEPSDQVFIHPELHDNDNGIKDIDSDNESDVSSIGCVSDPGGISQAIQKYRPTEIPDADVLDEYCGLSTLEAIIRKTEGVTGSHEQSKNNDKKTLFKNVLTVRPGTNYEKTSFEAKCFICIEKVCGTRTLGAHIRSEAHKNHFRNLSLKLAKYEEKKVPTASHNLFTARLAHPYEEYTSSAMYFHQLERHPIVYQKPVEEQIIDVSSSSVYSCTSYSNRNKL